MKKYLTKIMVIGLFLALSANSSCQDTSERDDRGFFRFNSANINLK